jgi:hypothetical protein
MAISLRRLHTIPPDVFFPSGRYKYVEYIVTISLQEQSSKYLKEGFCVVMLLTFTSNENVKK